MSTFLDSFTMRLRRRYNRTRTRRRRTFKSTNGDATSMRILPFQWWLKMAITVPVLLVIDPCMWIRVTASNVESSSSQQTSSSSSARPHRGTFLKEPLSVDDMYQAYQEMQELYRNQTFYRNDWLVLHEREGVQVATLPHPADPTCPYVRLRATIPVPVADCWEFLRVARWNRTMPLMDPYYEGVSVHGSWRYSSSSAGQDRKDTCSTDQADKEEQETSEASSKNAATTDSTVDFLLCRKRLKRLFAFGKRDLVFLSVTQSDLFEGSRVSGTLSVESPSRLPRQPGYTRAYQDSIAFYKPVEVTTDTGKKTEGCELTIVCRIDLNDAYGGGGGYIPMWLYVKTIGYTGAQSVLRMRRALVAAAGADVEGDTSASTRPPKKP